jgi:hypothetical protein
MTRADRVDVRRVTPRPPGRRALRERLALTLVGVAIAAHASGAEASPFVESPAASSLPVVDPVTRFTPQAPPRSNALDAVVVLKVGGLRLGPPETLEMFVPDLTSSSALELRQAYAGSLWKPSLGPDGEPPDRQFTLLVPLSR